MAALIKKTIHNKVLLAIVVGLLIVVGSLVYVSRWTSLQQAEAHTEVTRECTCCLTQSAGGTIQQVWRVPSVANSAVCRREVFDEYEAAKLCMPAGVERSQWVDPGATSNFVPDPSQPDQVLPLEGGTGGTCYAICRPTETSCQKPVTTVSATGDDSLTTRTSLRLAREACRDALRASMPAGTEGNMALVCQGVPRSPGNFSAFPHCPFGPIRSSRPQ